MKKAVLIQNYQDVKVLNELFDEGYVVESVDDNGVYVLNFSDLKDNPIKNQISTVIRLDTAKVQRQLKLLGETAEALKAQYDQKQPHIRIEFDDIRDVPKVWVDGELIGDTHSNKQLVNLKVDWNTDTAVEVHKEFDINYLDLSDESIQRKGFHQRTLI